MVSRLNSPGLSSTTCMTDADAASPIGKPTMRAKELKEGDEVTYSGFGVLITLIDTTWNTSSVLQ